MKGSILFPVFSWNGNLKYFVLHVLSKDLRYQQYFLRIPASPLTDVVLTAGHSLLTWEQS